MKGQDHISNPKNSDGANREALSKGELKSIRSLLRKRGREKAGRYLVEGSRLCSEALRWSQGVEKAVISVPIRSGSIKSLVDICDRDGIPVRETDESTLKILCDTVTPQGMVAVVRTERWDMSILSSPGNAVVVVLDGVSDPGNVGSVLRSAEAAGALAVIAAPGTVELHNPKVIRGSMGSIFRIPSFEDLPPGPLCDELKRLGYRIIALGASGGVPYTEVDFSGCIALVLGNEAWGLSDSFLEKSDISVSIPLKGNVESLNVSAAGAIILFRCAEMTHGGTGRI